MTPLRYLALGDSYTIGEGIHADGRWPQQLAAGLRAAGIAVAEPRILATTGWTTDELSAAMDAAEPLGQWDLVSLLIGVNNQYRGLPLAEYARSFDALLARATALAAGRAERVLVLSIPDWGVTPFARRELRSPRRIAAELDACN
ncbi:MAG: GDSL-type esterase/lipase family protein, partial [Thermomonas sp.]